MKKKGAKPWGAERKVVKAKKAVTEAAVPEPEVEPDPVLEQGPVCVECGDPVAPGQNLVCAAHVRVN